MDTIRLWSKFQLHYQNLNQAMLSDRRNNYLSHTVIVFMCNSEIKNIRTNWSLPSFVNEMSSGQETLYVSIGPEHCLTFPSRFNTYTAYIVLIFTL